MTRLALLLALALVWLGTPIAALAQIPEPTPTGETTGPVSLPQPGSTVVSEVIFPWASKPGGFQENWPVGLVHLLLGMAGALVTVYLFLGDFLPSMGGKAEYEALKQELADLKDRRERAIAEREKYAKGESSLPKDRLDAEDGLTDDLDRAIGRAERQITGERWRLFVIGFPIFVLLGGFFASAFAVNALQAIIVGFGWTAVADRLGLKREDEAKKEINRQRIDRLESEAIEAAQGLQRMEISAEKVRALAERASKEPLSAEDFPKVMDALLAEASRGPAEPAPGESVRLERIRSTAKQARRLL